MNERFVKVSAAAMAIGLAGYSTLSTAELNRFSVGIKSGKALVTLFDDFSEVSTDDGVALGFNIGYSFAPELTVEFEYISSTTEVVGPARSLDTDVTSTAIYAAYRSPDPVYFVGRVGFASVKLESDIVPSATETSASYSLGGGYRLLPNLAFEADYTIVEEDVDWLMLSVRYDLP